MSVTDIPTRKLYDCDGAAKNYPILYQYLAESDNTVKHIDSVGAITTLILDDVGANGFVITAGEVVTNTLYPNTDQIWLIRETPRTQASVRKNNRRTAASVDDGSYDKLTMIVQEMEDQADRTIYLVDTTPTDVSVELPAPVARRVPIWDATGKFLEYTTYDPDTLQSASAASAAAAAISAGQANSSELASASSANSAATSELNADNSATDAAASAAGVNLPAIQAGDKYELLSVNAGETGYVLGNKLYAPNGVEILDKGTDGTDATLAADVTGALNGTASALAGTCAPTTMTPSAWPSFSATIAGTQSNITSADKIDWDSEVFDTNNDFAAGAFTPTVAGKYLLTMGLYWANYIDGDLLIMSLYKNGVAYQNFYALGKGTTGQNIDTSLLVDANGSTDYFEIFAEDGSRDTADILTGSTYFTGCRIG